MKVSVDKNRCVGTGLCVLTSPDVFDQRDDGTVELRQETPPIDEYEFVREAARMCPSHAITVSDS
ncbi:ferredoxin [Haloechinothrix sp. YIM 98757]|uniref:Ferredoxin n=1 Tax=Haloechinothrix aidingensis TaxID=2752311 RepID=A0A838AC28_9PSEU|nr:ferredoxin [Haloechinothrix aidingensis]MBA0126728.1 ferredoxin [Haloechinothrix aidingensis]